MSECMTQEDAERMDEKQAIQILKPLMAMMRDQNGCPISAAYFAIGKAINALEEQDKIVRCKDCKYGDIVKNCFGFEKVRCKNVHNPIGGWNVKEKWLMPLDWFCKDGEGKDGQSME